MSYICIWMHTSAPCSNRQAIISTLPAYIDMCVIHMYICIWYIYVYVVLLMCMCMCIYTYMCSRRIFLIPVCLNLVLGVHSNTFIFCYLCVSLYVIWFYTCVHFQHTYIRLLLHKYIAHIACVYICLSHMHIYIHSSHSITYLLCNNTDKTL